MPQRAGWAAQPLYLLAPYTYFFVFLVLSMC